MRMEATSGDRGSVALIRRADHAAPAAATTPRRARPPLPYATPSIASSNWLA